MKKTLVRAVVFALGMSAGAAMAADIGNLNGQTCPAGMIGTWHFVNNQARDAAAGTLEAHWDSGNTCITGASKVNSSTQHFNCIATGTLHSASTNLPGKLVLSDFSCGDIKVCDPKTEVCTPPCDPKTQTCK